jgi:copper chaperone CopZ
MKLQEMEDNIPGIHQVDASYKKQELIVKFDETMVGEEQIITAAKELGYTAIKL